MAVEFILGRSGTGKTNWCLRSVVQALAAGTDEQPLILLVPEQATYQAERAILSHSRIAGYSRLRVLSFDRLKFLLLGKQSAKSDISRLGQEMIVGRILTECGEKLEVFGESSQSHGLAAELTKTIVELHECAKSPSDVADLAERMSAHDSQASGKFRDIAIIYQQYVEFIADKFINPDIQLSDAVKKVAESEFLQGARLWVDGFASFTIQQRDILIEMLKTASHASIALCLDADGIDVENPSSKGLDPLSMFGPTERSYAELVEIVRKCKLPLNDPVVLNKPLRFSQSPALESIERDLFATDIKKQGCANEDVSIIAAANSRVEVDCIAEEIVRLVRKDGYRFRDVAVIASDIGAYQHYIEASFGDYGIPFFIDRKKSLASHPVVEVVCSGLSAALDGFPTSDIFAYLKTDLALPESGHIDLLENYCVAFGIGAGDWISKEPWRFAGHKDDQFNEELVNKIRAEAIEPLAKLQNDLKGDGGAIGAEEFTCAVFAFLDNLQVREKIARQIELEPEQEGEHLQFFDKFASMFDEMVEVFAGEQIDAGEFANIIRSGLLEMTLAFIPPTLDQVLVGTIERSRHPDLKAVFLVGATQKQFPMPVTFESILSEDDRDTAAEYDFVLSDRLEQRLISRQYLAYIAFTRPSQRLYISYPLKDESGSAVVASAFLDNLKRLFGDLEEKNAADVMAGCLEEAVTSIQLGDMLCRKLGAGGEIPAGLIEAMCADDDREISRAGRVVSCAAGYNNQAELERCAQEETDKLDCSTSRLSTFAKCPYQHFAKYTLGLEKRKQFGFERVDLGDFYHRILDMMFRGLKGLGKDLATASDAELSEVLDAQIEKLITKDPAIMNFVRQCAHNRYIIDSASEVLYDCVRALSQMSKAGAFRQRASELRFGKDGQMQCKFSTASGKVVNLRGVIDRVDTATIDGKKMAVLFDYKRGGQSVSWEKLYHGLDTQLGVYMLAIKDGCIDGKKIDGIAGGFYLPIETKVESANLGNFETKGTKFGYKAKGIFDGGFSSDLNGDEAGGWDEYYNFYKGKDGPLGNFGNSGALRPGQLEEVLEMTQAKIVELAEQIFSGKIDVSPYRINKKCPCGYCDYRALCRFDWQINDYNFLPSMNKQTVLEGGGDE